MRTLSIRFSFLLPLIELAIWLVIVIVPATLTYLNLRAHTRPGDQVVMRTKRGNFTVPYEAAKRLAFEGPALKASHKITALNMPGFFGEILVSLPTSWPSSWHPEEMILDVWRAIIFPFFALPAWWLVGRGIDSLFYKRKPHNVSTVIGTLLFIGFIVLFCGLRFGLSPTERGESSWLLWGLGLWTILFASLPVAWFRSPRAHTNV